VGWRPPGNFSWSLADVRRISRARGRAPRNFVPGIRPSASPTSTWRITTESRPATPEIVVGNIIQGHAGGDELVIQVKPAIGMWPGPYGDWGLAKIPDRELRSIAQAYEGRLLRYLLLSSGRILILHWKKHSAPLETFSPPRQALYAGVSNYSGRQLEDLVEISCIGKVGRDHNSPALLPSPGAQSKFMPACMNASGPESFLLVHFYLDRQNLNGIPPDSRAVAGDVSGMSAREAVVAELIGSRAGPQDCFPSDMPETSPATARLSGGIR